MGRPGLSLDRKFKRLARALDDVQAGFGEMLARGALELLWDSAYEACDDYLGDVDDVEAQAHWRGKRGTLLAGLAGAGGEGRPGFVEEGGTEWWPEGKPGTYRIHDLWDHAPEYVEKRVRREVAREQKGTSISEIRSEAGKKGRRTQLGQSRANGGQTASFAEQAADKRRATGGQTDAVCPGGAGKTRANGETPAPAPAPAPAPSSSTPPPGIPTKAQHLAQQAPLAQALLDALGAAGWLLTHAAPDKRAILEAALANTGTDVACELVRGDLDVRASKSQETPGSLGFYVGDLVALSKRRAARPEPAAPSVPVLDLAWLDQLPEPRRSEARSAWEAKCAEVEAGFRPDSVPRVLAQAASLLRQEYLT